MIILTGDFNLHIDDPLDSAAQEFLNILNYMDFTQHVTQPTHNRGHTLDLVITYGLSTGVTSVVDLAVSDHLCVFFQVFGFIERGTSARTVKKRHLTLEVAENFIEVLEKCPIVLPAPCDFIVNDFNSRLHSALNTVAPLKTKSIQNLLPHGETRSLNS